jgi:hypothetical protein
MKMMSAALAAPAAIAATKKTPKIATRIRRILPSLECLGFYTETLFALGRLT